MGFVASYKCLLCVKVLLEVSMVPGRLGFHSFFFATVLVGISITGGVNLKWISTTACY